MTCQEVRALLDQHIDGELEPEVAERVATHLTSCDACRRTERSLRNVKLLVQAKADRPGLPADLRERVDLALEEERRVRDRRAARLRSPWIRAAAIVVLCAIAITVYSLVATPKLPVAHASVAEQSLAKHLDASGVETYRWPVQTADAACALLEEELGVAGATLPLRDERLVILGASPVKYGEVDAVRIYCEFDGKPMSLFALGSIPEQVRQRRQCFCREDQDRYLVACWADGDLYFSVVGTDVTRGEFVQQLRR